MILKLTLIIFTFGLISCGGNDSNLKDYWDLEEPIIHVSGTDANARVAQTSMPISQFKPSELTSSLGYESFLVFEGLTNEIKFLIETKCSEILEDGSKEKVRVFDSKSEYSRSDRIYFYDFLPEGVIVDDKFNNKSVSYSCDYKILAVNAINSKISYNLQNIKINTNEKNEIQIYSKELNSETRRSIVVDPEHAITDLPSMYLYEGANLNFEMGINLTQYKLTDPSYIKCIDQEQIKLKYSNNEVLLNDIIEPMEASAFKTNSKFFKKCRVISNVDSNTNLELKLNNQTGSSNSSRRLLWSEYFNVIFEKPELEIDIEPIPELRTTLYPFNYETYLDNEFLAFKIHFTNKSKSSLKMRLPSLQSIEAKLNPLVYSIQLPGHKPVSASTWGGLRTYQLNEEFLSEIRFMMNGIQIYEFNIQKDATETVDMVMYKNFKCVLPSNNLSNHEHKTAERGFRIQALPLDSEDDKIIIDYQNKGQLESFPETFSFNRLLESALANVKTTRLVNPDGKQSNTNLLQLVDSRTHVIDTIIFRDLTDLEAPAVPNFGASSAGAIRQIEYYRSSDWDQRNEILDARKSNGLTSQLRLKKEEAKYCQAL